MCHIIQGFFKFSSADGRQLLGIVASSSNDASGKNSFVFAPEDRYFDSNEWYALSKSDKDKVIKARSTRNGGKKASNSGRGRNNVQGKWKYKIAMLEKKVMNKKRQLSVFTTTAKYGSDNEDSDDSENEYGNMKHYGYNHQ